MPDPKMQALADYLRRNYRPAVSVPTPEQMPAMTDDQNRTAAFIRSAPARLPPPMRRQRAVAALLMEPTGGRSGRATRMSTNPAED